MDSSNSYNRILCQSRLIDPPFQPIESATCRVESLQQHIVSNLRFSRYWMFPISRVQITRKSWSKMPRQVALGSLEIILLHVYLQYNSRSSCCNQQASKLKPRIPSRAMGCSLRYWVRVCNQIVTLLTMSTRRGAATVFIKNKILPLQLRLTITSFLFAVNNSRTMCKTLTAPKIASNLA